ncbi:hypothetical protein BDF20DRAFT_827099 [Mycotypha africana]|uniref:uncharacterized protein n=1 Tax=Mycotypha africana TaxID=64632 RepID=UPI002300F29A|nr:uncharacterized protein BDF20DRAFT_827099 [Mycotypha africana]KAI8969331.1 hypothetical protein BDF20DRAFT_827099 [Mycotypha africana]
MKSNNKNTSTATTSKSSYSTFSVIKPTASTSSNSSSPPLRHTNKSAITAPTVTATTTSSTTDNAKPYPCPECHQTFSRPHNLKSHLTTHSSERPFQCDVCNHHFRRHHDLKRHQKLHTGERPYVCKDCYRSFARLDALNRHRRADGGTACSAVHHQQINKQQQQRPALVTSGSTSTSSIKSIVSKGSAKTTANVTTTPASAAGNTSDNTSPSSTNYSRPVIPQLHIPHPASHLHPKDYHPSPVAPPTSQMSSNTATNNYKLQQENEALKRDLDQIRAMAQRDINSMKARMHDLEVENKVLRSLIQNSSPQQQQQEQVVEDAKMDMDGDRPSNSSRYAHSRTASQASSIHPSEASEATVPASTGADPHMKTEFM